MIPEKVIRYGPDSLKTNEEVTLRYDGLDSVSQEWRTTNKDLFVDGGTVNGYPNVLIESVTRRMVGGDYVMRVTGVGLVNSKGTRQDIGYPKINVNLESLDDATDSEISTSAPYEIGDIMEDYPNMYCVAVARDPIYNNLSRWVSRFAGVVNSKPYKRKISVTTQVLNLESVTVAYPGGWSSPSAGQISIPTLQVQDTVVMTTEPDTATVGTNVTPDDPPSINYLYWSGDETKVWPNGWVLTSMDGDYIAGTTIWTGVITYEYRYISLPR